MVASQIHIVRHGEVENPAGVLYGRLPGFGLSDLGKKMAHAAAQDLLARGRTISALFASPLQRAQESAEPISHAFGLPIQTEHRIIEPTNRFEGMNPRARNAALRNPSNWSWILNPFKPSWGEPYRHISHRMLEALHDAHSCVEQGDVVLVSHQLPIWTTHLTLAGRKLYHDPHRRRCALSSITTLERRGELFVEIGYVDSAAALYTKATDVGAV